MRFVWLAACSMTERDRWVVFTARVRIRTTPNCVVIRASNREWAAAFSDSLVSFDRGGGNTLIPRPIMKAILSQIFQKAATMCCRHTYLRRVTVERAWLECVECGHETTGIRFDTVVWRIGDSAAASRPTTRIYKATPHGRRQESHRAIA